MKRTPSLQRHIINKFLDYRGEEERRLKEHGLDIGEVTALNLTKVEVSARTLLIGRVHRVACN